MSKTTVTLMEENWKAQSKAGDNINTVSVFMKLWFAKKLEILGEEWGQQALKSEKAGRQLRPPPPAPTLSTELVRTLRLRHWATLKQFLVPHHPRHSINSWGPRGALTHSSAETHLHLLAMLAYLLHKYLPCAFHLFSASKMPWCKKKTSPHHCSPGAYIQAKANK